MMFENILSFVIILLFHANVSFYAQYLQNVLICSLELANTFKLNVFSAMNIWFRMIKINF